MKHKLIIAFLSAAIFIISCKEKSGKTVWIPQLLSNSVPDRSYGSDLFHQNCSGCHSLKIDTTDSRFTLYDLYKIDSSILRMKMYECITDSNHWNKTVVQDSCDIESLAMYIKYSYKLHYDFIDN